MLLFKEAGTLLTKRKTVSLWAVVHELLKDCPEKCNGRHTGTKSCFPPSLSASHSLDREQAISSLSDKFKLKEKKKKGKKGTNNKTNETTNLKECQGLMIMKNCVIIGIDYLWF